MNGQKGYRHLILVSLDTLRADCIKASPRFKSYSKKHRVKTELRTPALDRLLRASLYFNNCFSAAPYTAASHGAYFTGCWPLNNNVYEFFNRKLTQPTIFQLAKKRGYRTIFQTDFPVILGPYLGFKQGIDDYFIEDENRALSLLKRQPQKPAVACFHFGGIHYPYGFHILKFGGKDYLNKIQKLEKKLKLSGKIDKLEDVLDESYRTGKDTALLLRYKMVVEKLYAAKAYDELFELYLQGINYFMSRRFNPFLTKLLKFVDRENALLIVFSDHGEEWDKTSEGHHNSIDDQVLRVPLLIYGQGIKPGVVNQLVRTIDLAPTLAPLLQKILAFIHNF